MCGGITGVFNFVRLIRDAPLIRIGLAMKAKRVRTDVWLPEELKPFAGKIGYVQSQPFADTFSLTFPNEPLCKDGDYTWVPDFFVYQVEDVEAQQQAEATPDTPASVDGFLFGKDVDVKRLQAHELHEADGAPVEDKDARIRQLEGIIASHSASLLHEAHKSEQLQALLSEAAQVIAPVKDAVDYDTDLMKVRDIAMTYVLNSDGDEYVQIETECGFLEARHLRAIAEFAAKLKGVTNDAT
jgi:hypothetical protein